MFLRKVALCSVVVSVFASCNQTSFTPDASYKDLSIVFEDQFKVASSEVQFVQPDLSENHTRISFQVQAGNGLLLQDLLKSQINITENGKSITNVTLQKTSKTYQNVVDIVFAVDVTGSMTKTIESAKQKLIDFIQTSRKQNYHTRMCLSTFGDYTVKKCLRFYNNDINDPSSSAEVNELISEISKLKALVGAEDPGGRDFDENPMRAVIDASLAPWGDQSQRFLILVTDAGFLYSPGNSGSVGPVAPQFSEVSTAIQNSKMKIFAVTPSLAGYNLNFNSSPSIVKQSSGEWFAYSDLVSGKISLNTVLDKILSQVDTTFFVDYKLNSQSELDPSLPLSQRNIQVSLINPLLGLIKGLVISSNLPQGRIPDPKDFVFTDKKVKDSTLQVFVDGVLQKNNYQVISGNKIQFTKAQPANSKIVVKFQFDQLKDAVQMKPIQFRLNSDYINKINLYINDHRVDPKNYSIVSIDSETYGIVLNDSIFDATDEYEIQKISAMNVMIRLN